MKNIIVYIWYIIYKFRLGWKQENALAVFELIELYGWYGRVTLNISNKAQALIQLIKFRNT